MFRSAIKELLSMPHLTMSIPNKSQVKNNPGHEAASEMDLLTPLSVKVAINVCIPSLFIEADGVVNVSYRLLAVSLALMCLPSQNPDSFVPSMFILIESV